MLKINHRFLNSAEEIVKQEAEYPLNNLDSIQGYPKEYAKDTLEIEFYISLLDGLRHSNLSVTYNNPEEKEDGELLICGDGKSPDQEANQIINLLVKEGIFSENVAMEIINTIQEEINSIIRYSNNFGRGIHDWAKNVNI